MRALSGASGAAAALLRARWRILLGAVLLGGLAGLGWGLSEQRTYAATATVLVADRGDAVGLAGAGVVGGSGPAAAERLNELARGDDVSELAAASLGGDLSGVDLLAQTDFRTGDRGGALVVRSTADFADFAAATANAYADAIVQLATLLERRRLRSAEQRAAERLAGLDPASEQAIALQERIDALVEVQELGPPLRAGRMAELPAEPEAGRSAALATLTGAALGALLALLWAAAQELYRRPVRRVEQLRVAVGVPFVELAGPTGAALALRRRPDGELSSTELGDDRLQAVAVGLGLDAPDPRRSTVAVVSAMPAEGKTTLAVGIAAAVARRRKRVLLLETDLRRPTVASRLAIDPEPGLSDYLAGEASPREVIRPLALSGGSDPGERPVFVCVPAGSARPAPLELLAGPRFATLLDQLQRVYDLVVLDTPPLLVAGEASIVASAASATVVCGRAGVTRAADLRRAVGRLDRGGILGGVLIGTAHSGPGRRRLPPPGPAGPGETDRRARIDRRARRR